MSNCSNSNITNTLPTAAITSTINVVTGDVSALTTRVTTAEGNITTLQGTVQQHEDSIYDLTNICSPVGESTVTLAELQQVANINSNIISSAQWGYLGNTNQNVSSTSSPTFSALTVTSLNGLTTTEIDQLKNIDSVAINNTKWGYLGAMNQNVTTTSNVSFNSVQLPSTGGTPSSLNHYEELTQSLSLLDSPVGDTSITMRYVRTGKQVTIVWQQITGTATVSNKKFSGTIPSQFRLASGIGDILQPIHITNSGAISAGTLRITPAGLWQVSVGAFPNENNFTGSGTYGLWTGSASYVTTI